MKIPFVDLNTQYLNYKSEIDEAISKVIQQGAFISGEYASRFEKDFQEYTGQKHCIACANGTDSLEILLKAMGVGMGDEVIVPAISWISTSEAVSSVGAKPVFVDIDDDNLIDCNQIESSITNKTKAIIPVHLYGNPVDMTRILDIAKKHRLKVIEDCAQSHGSEIGGQLAGTFGDAASYSFYPGKNLGAYGDAGAMTTNDDQLAEICRMIANHGQKGKHNHLIEGRNSRMDGIQGAVLSIKLKYLKEWTESRIKNAALYDQHLGTEIRKPNNRSGFKQVFHLYVIRSARRDELSNYLKENGVENAIHYPVPLPLMPCYTSDPESVKKDFPKATKAAAEILSLPMYAELTENQIKYIASLVRDFEGVN